MKKVILLAMLLLPLTLLAQEPMTITNPVDMINPLMGTASKPIMSSGNTYPAVAVPWGMNFWTAQTGKMGYGWQLADYDVTAEITPTERAANFRFTFPKSDSSHILIDAFDKQLRLYCCGILY